MSRIAVIAALVLIVSCGQQTPPLNRDNADAPDEKTAPAPPAAGGDEKPAAETQDAPAAKVYVRTFEKDEIGKEPQGLFFVLGDWTVEEFQGKRVLRLKPTPLDVHQVIFDERNNEEIPAKVGDHSAQVRVHGERRGRAKPMMGVGLGGISGYMLRLNAPARKIEILYEDESVASESFAWKSGKWYVLRIDVMKTGDKKWDVRGKAWPADEDEPAKPSVRHAAVGELPDGDPSIFGFPISGLPMYFDALTVRPLPPAGK